MKKLLIVLSLISLMFFISCNKENKIKIHHYKKLIKIDNGIKTKEHYCDYIRKDDNDYYLYTDSLLYMQICVPDGVVVEIINLR